MKCLKCHAEIDEVSRFCTVCGTKVPDWKKLKALAIGRSCTYYCCINGSCQ